MKKIFILSQLFLAAGLLWAAGSRQARNDSPRIQKQLENRFLFIVDTASAMRSYSNAVVQDVAGLLESDMKGEFRQGDTIGLWTYNDILHPEFPMQVWSKEDKTTIIADTAAFLQRRHYEKRAHLEKVMPALNYVIKSSERVTVILIFDGAAMIQGTPFDGEINDLQKAYARELRAAHEPFVVVFAARDGAIYDYTINYPGAIAIPHTANPEKPAETNAPEAVAPIAAPVTNLPPVIPTGPSLYLSGSKKTFITNAPAPAPVAETVATPVVAPPEQPARQSAAAAVPAPAPVDAVASSSQPARTAVAPPRVVPVNPPVIAVAAPPPHEVAPAQTQPPPPPVVAQQRPEPAGQSPPSSAPPANARATDQQLQSAPPVARNAPVANVSPVGSTEFAFFVVAISLLTIAGVLVVFLVRRSRGAPQPSLISQSIDRPQ